MKESRWASLIPKFKENKSEVGIPHKEFPYLDVLSMYLKYNSKKDMLEKKIELILNITYYTKTRKEIVE